MAHTLDQNSRLSVAPMMEWTDRHCRYFHRQMSRHALLYTEMVTAQAVIHGDRERLLGFDDAEHPVALQVGGSDPKDLAKAVRIANGFGYDEINLNVGCPSDRVQSGCFGAVLMKQPDLVAECVSEMIAVSDVEVTVKCRIGVDDQDPEEVLPGFLSAISAAGVRRITIHARKAWLKGLSPKENREVPPLEYALVHRMKQGFPDLHLSINGGIATLDEAQAQLEAGMDGVMIGRAAYHTPESVLLGADQRIFNDPGSPPTIYDVIERMRPYIAHHLEAGGRLHSITRHMLGVFAGRPGARAWRRVLSQQAVRPDAGLEALDMALGEVTQAA